MTARRWLHVAAIASIGVACNGIRAAPIHDDEDLDAGHDAPAEATPRDAGVDAATDADADAG